jgi:STE24 endopeptidase
MTTMSAHLPVSASRLCVGHGHFGAWRAMAAVPSRVAGLLLMVVLLGWLGRWECLALLGWLISGVAVPTRVGARAVVRVSCGFHLPNTGQAVLLAPVWATALEQCAIAPSEVDLYVRRRCEANAYAVGGRSVAVTTGVLGEFQARRLRGEHLAAVLVHELGHHATRATRLALVTIWLAALWRCASRFLIGVGLILLERQRRRLLSGIVVAGVFVSIVQAGQRQQWMVALVLGAIALAAVVCPVADAAVGRRSEYAADCYAAGKGLCPQLVTALEVLDSRREHPALWTSRLLSPHPDVQRPVVALRQPKIKAALRRLPAQLRSAGCQGPVSEMVRSGWNGRARRMTAYTNDRARSPGCVASPPTSTGGTAVTNDRQGERQSGEHREKV